MLSSRQFSGLAAELNKPDGGFSVDLHGRMPKDRFMVGIGKAGPVPHPVKGSDVRDYVQKNLGDLSQHEHYLGGWEYQGTGTLDVSRGLPNTPSGEVETRGVAMDVGETGYGVIDKMGEYQGTRYNPFSADMKRGDIVASDDPKQRQIWKEMPRHSAQAARSKPPVTITAPRGGTAGGSIR